MPTLPPASPLARHWKLDPHTAYLNHGSFGACPIPVLNAQSAYRDRMEGDGVRWFIKEMYPLLDRARESLARVVDASPADLVFVPNATTGVTTALASLDLKRDDQILAPDQEYPACLNNAHHIAQREGASVVSPRLPFPLTDPQQVVEAVLGAIDPKGATKVALLSHVTSPTGLIMPVDRLIPVLRERGIVTIIDGAHGPGFHPISIRSLNPDFYTANCHKWLCSPKGSAFLYVRPPLQAKTRPVVLSNFARSGHPTRPFFQAEFDYVGTDDITAYLAIHDAIDFMGSLGGTGGLHAVMEKNRSLALSARRHLTQPLGVNPPAPESMLGSLVALLLPPHEAARDQRLMARPTIYADALQDALYDRHAIQVPVWRFGAEKRRLLRISAQVYNTIEQFEFLATSLKAELDAERQL